MPEQLRLDVARALEVTLAEDGVVTERSLRLATGCGEGFASSARERTTRMPRPPPPAAALITSGKPISSGEPWGSVGTPFSTAIL